MKKRNLFAEISEGFDALAAERAGKITLRRHSVDTKPMPPVTPEEPVGLRLKLNLRALYSLAICALTSERSKIGSKVASTRTLKPYCSSAWSKTILTQWSDLQASKGLSDNNVYNSVS